MEIIFVRHGLPQRVSGEAGSSVDAELSADGWRQAGLLADYLSDRPITVVYSSPLRRARETASPLATRLAIDVTVLDCLAEYDRGTSEYIPVEELKAEGHPMWGDIVAGRVQVSLGVDPRAFRDDVVDGIESMIAAHQGTTIVAVCHGGVINAYISHILGIDDPAGFFYADYTSVHRVRAAQSGQRTLLSLNDTTHLWRTGLSSAMLG